MIATLCSMLIKELNILKSHLHGALMQLNALKAVQEEANGSSTIVIIIPIDLSDQRMQSLYKLQRKRVNITMLIKC